jgi:hypothetical protein
MEQAPIRILNLDKLDAFDTVEVDDIEACRRLLGSTPSEFAEQLGWSLRKYQRALESIREDGFAERDIALAVRGLVDVVLRPDDEHSAIGTNVEWNIKAGATDRTFFGSRTFPTILTEVLDDYGEWTAQVTPHLMRLVAVRGTEGKYITYGEAATTLEERGLTKRVWPRTVYGAPLGAICNAVMQLGRQAGVRIPLLSAIVVKGSGEPGAGVDGMIRKFLRQHENEDRAKELLTRLKRDRDGLIGELQREVFAFAHWPGALWALGLQEG